MAADYELYMSEYERGLLSLSMRNLEILTELRQKITGDYFLYPPHKVIWAALCSLSTQPELNSIDLESLYLECNKLGLQKFNINPEYLTLVSQGGFDKVNFEFYLAKVKDAYLKFSLARELESSYRLLKANAKDGEKELSGENLIEGISSNLSKLYTFHGLKDEAIDIAERVEPFVLERASNAKEVMGLETGFPMLDKAINGLMPGTLTVIAGKAKAGKSTVLTNLVDHVAIESANPVPVLVISTEMYTDEDIARMVAIRSLVEERKIANGTAYNDPKLRNVIIKAVEQIKAAKRRIFHIYSPDFNVNKICNLIYHYKLKHNIGLAIFDYIKMTTSGDDSKEKREDQVLGDLSTALKNMAGKLAIPIVTACQVNTRTGLIADSDRIERYCNTLIHFRSKNMEELEDQDFFKYGTHWLHVYRTRSGGNIKIPVRFWKKCLKLQEAELFAEEEEVNDTRDLLTTPAEWQEMQNEAFTLDRVVEVVREEILAGPVSSSGTGGDDDDLF